MSNNPYVIYIGATDIDEYYTSSGSWPELGSKAVFEYSSTELGGMISNAACVMAGYGREVYLVDTMNNSADSNTAIEKLKEYNIKTDYIFRNPDIKSSKCIIFLSEGDRTIIVVDPNKPMLKFSKEHTDLFNNALYLYSNVGDITHIENAREVIATAKSHGTKIFLDFEAGGDFESKEWILDYTDVISINKYAFKQLRDGKSEEETIKNLFARGLSVIVVTLGADGSVVHTKDSVTPIPGMKFEPVDTTGAGDTFNSSFLFALTNGSSPEDAAKFATCAAGRAVTIYGPKAGVCDKKTIDELVAKNFK